MAGSQGQFLRTERGRPMLCLRDACTPSIVQITTWSFGDASAEPAGEGLQRLLPDW